MTRAAGSGPRSSMASDILGDAAQAIQDRASRHGDSYLTHQRIADLWSAYTGRCLSPTDVVRMMILLKIARSQEGNEADPDHATDMAGYAALLDRLAR
jgi:hypothetical protein